MCLSLFRGLKEETARLESCSGFKGVCLSLFKGLREETTRQESCSRVEGSGFKSVSGFKGGDCEARKLFNFQDKA